MVKGIAVYGSTGSIGTQTLDITSKLGNFEVVSIACNSNTALLEKQILRYKPRFAAVVDEKKGEALRHKLSGSDTEVLCGPENAIEVCLHDDVETVVNATVGISGLVPTVEFIEHGKDVALANKETLVAGGKLIMDLVKEKGVNLYPIDSEHSAIWQCLQGNENNRIEKLIITASGGPFRTRDAGEMGNISVEEALNHPTWKMGGRITIDSATLMNKGFEVIEARWLFGIGVERMAIVIHPQSIVHSAVQFEDGSLIAQLGLPDMKLPIQYALNYPQRIKNDLPRLELAKCGALEFYAPDLKKFRCLALAFRALAVGGTMPAVLNGADEKAVELFLKRRIGFLDIARSVESALDAHKVVGNPNIEDILGADAWARDHVMAMHKGAV